MRARAPGKVVLSGAYAVLEGAPAIVAAVDRYVLADSERASERVTDEVRAAIGDRDAPFFDAGALRAGDRKLGLGSSAAILVASLGALELAREPDLTEAALVARVYPAALVAHAQAQGGGSGIDVAASAHGGVLVGRRGKDGLELSSLALPEDLYVHVFSAREPAFTPELVRGVQRLKLDDASRYARLMGRQKEASERALEALTGGNSQAFIRALCEQYRALVELGEASGVPIVTPEVSELQAHAERTGAAALPSGAGGGDLALFVSNATNPPPVVSNLEPLSLRLGARGLERVP